MIQEIVQIGEIDIRHINPFVLEHLPFHDPVVIPVLDVVIAKKIQRELDQAQIGMNFTNEENLNLFINLLEPTLEIDSFQKVLFSFYTSIKTMFKI